MNIRRACRKDYPFFVKIESQYPSIPNWSEDSFIREENNPHSVTLTAEEDGKVLAFLNFWLLRPNVEVNLIVVDKSFLRRGIASKLFTKMREYAKKSLCKRILLEVSTENKTALSFYLREGFIIEGKRPKFYNGGTDALLLGADLFSGK